MLSPSVKTFIDQVLAASREAEIGEAFLNIATELGFTEFLMLDPLRLTNRLEPAIICGTQNAKSGAIAYDRKSSLGSHPLIRAAFETDQPFRCEEIRKSLDMTATAWRSSLPAPSAAGSTGVVLPVHRNRRLVMVTNAVGERPDDTAVAVAALHVCTHMAYDRLTALRQAEDADRALTKREATCLRWVSEGKTDLEIGEILHIAPRTVRYHIANAKRKLGAGSRLEAVAKKVTDFEE